MESTPLTPELNDLIHALIHLDDADDIYASISDYISKILPTDRASISLISSDGTDLETIGIFGKGANSDDSSNVLPVPMADTGIEAAILAGRAHSWIPAKSTHFRESPVMTGFGLISIINAPVFIDDQVIACLNSGSASMYYTNEHVLQMEATARIISSSLNKLRHLRITAASANRHRIYARHLEILNEIGHKLSLDDSMAQALDTVADGAAQLVNATRVSYCQLDPAGKTIILAGLVGQSTDQTGLRIGLEESGLSSVLLNGESLFISGLQPSMAPPHRRLIESGLNYLWAFPVITTDPVRAAITFGSKEMELEPQDAKSVLMALSRLLNATMARILAQKASLHAHEVIVDDCPLMLCLLDESGQLIRVSRFGAEVLGYDDSLLHKQTFLELHPEENHSDVQTRIGQWTKMDTTAVDSCEVLMKNIRGENRWIRQTVRRTTDIEGTTRLLVVCEDIHELKAMASRLKLQAQTDPLTGLVNRAEFNARLTETLLQAEKKNFTVSIMFFDLDNFKNTNDSLGHAVGDRVLRTIAERLEGTVESSDLVGRIGGDEFLAMFSHEHSRRDLKVIAGDLIEAIAKPIEVGSQALHISTSIGISQYPQNGATAEELVKNADIAMYKAKDLGKNQCYVYADELSVKLIQSARLERALHEALQDNELSLVYQPQINLLTGQVDTLEALLRWEHKTDGFISPDVFIQVAENSGLIIQLTDWVLNESLGALCRIREYHPDIKMAVNVSAVEFSGHFQLLERVQRAIKFNKTDPTALELELTETALLKNPQAASDLVHALSQAGVQLAVDDFGTGYGSLSYLVHLPIDAIKIDRSFVDQVDTDKKKQAVVAGLSAIASNLDLRCIGEGIETLAQLEWLSGNGCGHAQGYLFSKPVPERDLRQTLTRLSQLDQDVQTAA